MSYATAQDGTKLYVKDWGSGRPVVLIHGWPLSADSWDQIAVPLVEAGHRVIAYDRRGFGRSDQPWNGYDYDTFADDLKTVLDAAEVTGKASLVGFSMGGGEVARYLSRHGADNIEKVALISSVVPYLPQTDDNRDGVPPEALAQFEEQMRDDRAAFLEAFFKNFYGVGFINRPVSSAVLHQSNMVGLQSSLRAMLAAAKAFGSTDFRPDLAAFTVPTLIVHGTSDNVVPIDATGRAAARAIPGSTLIEYDGAPHGLFATERERLTGDLLNFLGSGASAFSFGEVQAEQPLNY